MSHTWSTAIDSILANGLIPAPEVDMTPETVADAIKIIGDNGLNKIRCSLTGAPYASIEYDEIQLALRAEIESNTALSAEALADRWQLKALTLNSGVAPCLRNATKLTLNVIATGSNGKARVINYCLSRLFFPAKHNNGRVIVSTQRAIERMQFAATSYDAMVELSNESDDYLAYLDELIQNLTACDSYCSLAEWQNIPLFYAKRATQGVFAAKNADVAEWFKSPNDFEPTQENLKRLSDFLMTLLCDAAAKDVTMPAVGDRLATSMFTARADAIPFTALQHKPKGSKKLHGSDATRPEDLAEQNPKWYADLNKAAQTKYAWSATHGQGVKMRETPAKKERKPKVYKNRKVNAFMAIKSIKI